MKYENKRKIRILEHWAWMTMRCSAFIVWSLLRSWHTPAAPGGVFPMPLTGSDWTQTLRYSSKWPRSFCSTRFVKDCGQLMRNFSVMLLLSEVTYNTIFYRAKLLYVWVLCKKKRNCKHGTVFLRFRLGASYLQFVFHFKYLGHIITQFVWWQRYIKRNPIYVCPLKCFNTKIQQLFFTCQSEIFSVILALFLWYCVVVFVSCQ